MLELIQHVSSIVASTKDLATRLQATVTLVQSVLEIERCSILLLNASSGYFEMRAAAGIPESEWNTIKLLPGEGIAGAVIVRREAVFAEDISLSEFAAIADFKRYQSPSFISVPLIVQNQVIGVINATSSATSGRRFTETDLHLIDALAGLLALTIENARLLEAAENSHLKLKNLVDNLPQAVCTLAPSETILDTNEQFVRFLQLSPSSSPEGCKMKEIFPAQLICAMADLKEEVLSYGIGKCREIELDLPPVGMTPVEVFLAPLTQPDGKIEGLLLSLSDLSMRNEVRELRRVDEMKSHFLSMISHELRTPLTAIKGAVHLLLSKKSAVAGSDTPPCAITNIVHTNTERLIRLVNDLLDMVNLENQELALIKQPVALNSLLQKCMDAYKSAAEAKSVGLESTLTECWVFADPNRLYQALSHIVDNAVKFTPRHGRINVSLECNGSNSVISVKDTGCGISPDAKKRLFTKFYQAQDPLTRSCGGAGIGLYIAKSLIELHGGRVSAGPCSSQGAEFVVELPLTEPQSTFGLRQTI